jgi:hypothetical protein
MPTNAGCGLNDGERLFPAGPPAAQAQPEAAVDDETAGPEVPPLEDGTLMAERDVLDHEAGAAGGDRDEGPDDDKEAVEHPRARTAVGTEGNRAHPRATRASCIGAQLVEGQGGRGHGEEHQPQGTSTIAVRGETEIVVPETVLPEMRSVSGPPGNPLRFCVVSPRLIAT